MRVTYRPNEDAATFKRDFCHLYYRICQLGDYIISYLVRGDLLGIVTIKFKRAGYPFIEEVTFDDEDALRYQEKMARFFAQPTRKQGKLPYPDFAVELKINYADGNTEMKEFDFKGANDDRISAFCDEIKKESDRLWRESLRRIRF